MKSFRLDRVLASLDLRHARIPIDAPMHVLSTEGKIEQ